MEVCHVCKCKGSVKFCAPHWIPILHVHRQMYNHHLGFRGTSVHDNDLIKSESLAVVAMYNIRYAHKCPSMMQHL